MNKLVLQRRKFLTGAAATLFCAPAIVRATSLMAVHDRTSDWNQKIILKWVYRLDDVDGRIWWYPAKMGFRPAKMGFQRIKT